MIEIDGSHGEGGGQILRLAVALSSVTQQPVTVHNIRAKRPNPGLRPQHVMALNSVAQICNATTDGIKLGSSSIRFYPRSIEGGTYSFNVGTAGSITLVLQACILPALFATRKVNITVTGGTDVKWSPPWDYFQYVFLPLLEKMNIKVHATLLKRGYYPKGEGKAVVTITPMDHLHPLQITEKTGLLVKGVVHSANLPSHISQRVQASALDTLGEHHLTAEIQTLIGQSSSPGVGIVLWAHNGHILGADCLGEKGLPAEKIGQMAAGNLMMEVASGTPLDIHAVDQLLPYLTLAKTPFFLCREISQHAHTEMWLLQEFLHKKFIVEKTDNLYKISIQD